MTAHLRISIGVVLLAFTACQPEHSFDATGAFEADEIVISAEVGGVLRRFTLQEGQLLQAGQPIGYIDTTQLFLRKKQLQTQVAALLGKKPDIPVQLAAFTEQLSHLNREKQRVENLLKADAATPKQLDDLNAQIALIHRQMEAQRSALEITSQGLSKEVLPLLVQIEQLDDQLRRSYLLSPIAGTVLVSYAAAHEMTTPGKALYKIADLSELTVRAYVSANQLPALRLGQAVEILTDNGSGGFDQTSGKLFWISDKAEFTPKTIQTKEERANLVYAIQVRVPNPEGRYKIGMYAELNFLHEHGR